MPSNSDLEMVYAAHSESDRYTALGALVRRRTEWGGRGVVLRRSNIRYVDMSFFRCKEE